MVASTIRFVLELPRAISGALAGFDGLWLNFRSPLTRLTPLEWGGWYEALKFALCPFKNLAWAWLFPLARFTTIQHVFTAGFQCRVDMARIRRANLDWNGFLSFHYEMQVWVVSLQFELSLIISPGPLRLSSTIPPILQLVPKPFWRGRDERQIWSSRIFTKTKQKMWNSRIKVTNSCLVTIPDT